MALSDSEILSNFDKLDSNSKKMVEEMLVAGKQRDVSEYVYGRLSFAKNQHAFYWRKTLNVDGKKKTFSISTNNIVNLTKEQIRFVQEYGNNEAKFLVRSNKHGDNIVELWLQDQFGSFIPVDSDILKYKSGSKIRKANGFCGSTFLPVSTEERKDLPPIETKAPSVIRRAPPKGKTMGETNIAYDATMDDIKSLVSNIQESDKIVNEEEIAVDSGLTKQEKINNTREFLKDMDNQLFDIFRDFDNREVNIENNKHIRFSMTIEEASNEDAVHKDAVTRRNHGGTKLDAVDGEAMFSYLMNPIFKRLGFYTRFKIDGRRFEKMGDNGDFSYGTQRLDIKTRQKKNPKYRHNLLVNESATHKGFNEYALVLREGDPKLEGKQRRLTFIGTATAEKVTSNPAKFINGGKKYEVEIPELESLRVLISRVLLEVLEKEER